ncbi:MAG: hypothetical protein NXI22_01920 [bacterium]|nr:hypothetical protein [bacterium]
MPSTESVPADLPAGSTVESIAYVPADSKLPHELFVFPKSLGQKAVVLNGNAESHPVDTKMLSVPVGGLENEATLATAREWVDQSQGKVDASVLVMSLQNVQVFWSPKRIAVIAENDRLNMVRSAIVEVNHYVAELAAIEDDIDAMWPHYDADLAMAFEYNEQASYKRKELSQRFQQAYKLRARLARITPLVLSPHTYPPTLASQISERLRERMRVEDRVEFISDKIEVFEDMYEMCNQRSNDYLHAKSGNTLEWIIIVLLIFQLIMSAFDYLTYAGT